MKAKQKYINKHGIECEIVVEAEPTTRHDSGISKRIVYYRVYGMVNNEDVFITILDPKDTWNSSGGIESIPEMVLKAKNELDVIMKDNAFQDLMNELGFDIESE